MEKAGKKTKTWFARVIYDGKEAVYAFPVKKQRDDFVGGTLSDTLYNDMQRTTMTRHDVVKKYGSTYKIEGNCVYDPRDPAALFDAWHILEAIKYRSLVDNVMQPTIHF